MPSLRAWNSAISSCRIRGVEESSRWTILSHCPFNVSCLMNCRGKELLLASFVMGLGGVFADGCQQFSSDSMVHRNSGFRKHGASCLDMSEAFLPCSYAFVQPALVVLQDFPEFEEFCTREWIINTQQETSLSSVVD